VKEYNKRKINMYRQFDRQIDQLQNNYIKVNFWN